MIGARHWRGGKCRRCMIVRMSLHHLLTPFCLDLLFILLSILPPDIRNAVCLSTSESMREAAPAWRCVAWALVGLSFSVWSMLRERTLELNSICVLSFLVLWCLSCLPCERENKFLDRRSFPELSSTQLTRYQASQSSRHLRALNLMPVFYFLVISKGKGILAKARLFGKV